ncbi:hypothetical protein AC629_21720 [Bradyrhizobium sp. NAS80.1]|nr:hypothetical protein AC629_21720 [Bradyrhizobium sp. NAS80.1]
MAYADRAEAVMGVWPVILIACPGGRATMANAGRFQRVGDRDAGGPIRRDRRQDLHHQREQDDRKTSF